MEPYCPAQCEIRTQAHSCTATDDHAHSAVFSYSLKFFLSWHDSPLVGLGLLLIHGDFYGF